MRRRCLFLLFFFIAPAGRAQVANYTAFTVNDGLPSNYVYRCIEDDKGFLWVATDAGIARFDGKHFQVFTTREGLPDNEVLAVVKENSGRIWVNCFKQKPAYFDEVKNRFINAREDKSLAMVPEGTGVMHFFPLLNGGIMFCNEKGSFIYRDGRFTSYIPGRRDDWFFVKENKDGTELTYGESLVDPSKQIWQSKIFLKRGTQYLDSVLIHISKIVPHPVVAQNEGKFYLLSYVTGKCYIYSNFNAHPVRFRVDSVAIPEAYNNFEFTPESFYLLGISGKIYLFDKNTLKQQAVVSGNYLPNSLYKDSNDNLWVSTIDKGLLLIKKRNFDKVAMPPGFSNTNFLSIARKTDGTVLAGNFYGEVVASGRRKISVNTIQKNGLIARQRKILISSNKIFSFSESGICSDYKKNLGIPGKTAVAYNDSIIIVGQSFGLQKLNTLTEKLTTLNALRKRVTALTSDVKGLVYFGSTDGLYKYSFDRNVTVPYGRAYPLLRERIAGLCLTPDGLLWVATAGNGLLVLKDEKLLLQVADKEGVVNNAARSITPGRPNQVWLGTAGGISVINYALRNNNITYTIQNLTVNDGLTSNVINELLCQNDTIYAATASGITVLPANASIPKFNIPVQLIHMSINQRDTVISPFYKLGYNQQNLQMEFAGIELSGHFKNLQYTLDKNRQWIDLNENTLAIELGSGNHMVQVRAVDVNGNISHKILTIKFDIATPFWKAVWFWLITAFLLQMAVIYWLNRRIKSAKEANLAKQIAGVQLASLEQQAFTSLMNPHFMFNALNSIQHYINLQDRQSANRYLSDFASLIRKNFEAAQQSFVPLEQEVENIKIYLRLEQMRFNDRFSYQLSVDELLDIEDWMIPTMILQPLLENALLHGIMPSSISGKITIDLKAQDGNLLITIADNGIGIANSLALKAPNGHRSRGMELIKKRIAALSRFGANPITISISPAFESEKNPGNKIMLFIPKGLYQAWLAAQR